MCSRKGCAEHPPALEERKRDAAAAKARCPRKGCGAAGGRSPGLCVLDLGHVGDCTGWDGVRVPGVGERVAAVFGAVDAWAAKRAGLDAARCGRCGIRETTGDGHCLGCGDPRPDEPRWAAERAVDDAATAATLADAATVRAYFRDVTSRCPLPPGECKGPMCAAAAAFERLFPVPL